MTTLEIERHDWPRFPAASSPHGLPSPVAALLRARTKEQARAAHRQIDNTAAVSDTVYPVAIPTTMALMAGLLDASAAAREDALDLLVRFVSGDHEPHPEFATIATCVREVARRAWILFRLLEIGSTHERSAAADLLGVCALHDAELRERVLWHLAKARDGEPGATTRELLANWIAELTSAP